MLKTGKDTLDLEEGRELRSKDIKFKFHSQEKMDVLDDKGNIKYFVELDWSSRQTHECTCRSFQHGNHDEYLKANGKNFECKHIKAGYNSAKGNP